MCGFLGVVIDPAHHALPAAPEFGKALDRLSARGPDDASVWSDDTGAALLGHRRLAVQDLSRNALQPMASADGRQVIVFNGEIYNHRELRAQLGAGEPWRSGSDTETLLAAYRRWGPDCLARLDGMFAFAVWDRSDRSVFLARDRLGKKPLYYARSAGRVLFASRPAALLPLLGGAERAIDEEALRAYLELGCIPAPLSLHRGIRKLAQAHYLHLRGDRGQPVRYWEYRHLEPEPGWRARSQDALADELESLLGEAVRKRLIGDVPMGAFLSGGVDSAAVVAALRAQNVEVPVFTIGFDDARYDESAAARRIGTALGVDEHLTRMLSTQDLLALLPDYLRAFDEPSADTSAFPTMAVARLARQRVTVALSGDGGDELFAGYPYYRWVQNIGTLLPYRRTRHLLSAALGRVPRHRAQLLSGALRRDDVVSLFAFLRSFGKDFPSLLHPDVQRRTLTATEDFQRFAAGFPPAVAPAEVGMRLDAQYMLVDGYFQKVDLASMAFSLEVRCPFADLHLVEWSMRLPLEYKQSGSATKRLLRRVLARRLPADLVHLPKRGFGVPMAQWLRGPLRSWAEAMLHDPSLLAAVPLNPDPIHRLLRAHLAGQRDAHPLLWAVLMLLTFVAREQDPAAGTPLPALAA